MLCTEIIDKDLFILIRLLPTVKKIVYMDVDMTVTKDLQQFINEADQLDTKPFAFINR